MSRTLIVNHFKYIFLIAASLNLISCTFIRSKITDFSSKILAEESVVSTPTSFNDGTDSWSKSDTPLFSWTEASVNLTAETIVDYEIKIGTTAGGSDIKEFTSVGNVLQASFSSLSLTKGSQYFASIRAKTSLGKYSTTVNGDGWYVNADMMVPNTAPSAIEKSGTTLYLGGIFSSFGYLTGSFAQISATTGQPDWLNQKPTFDGIIYSTISDGNGGYYVGGQFTRVNGVSRTNLAHILSDGSLNPNFTFTT